MDSNKFKIYIYYSIEYSLIIFYNILTAPAVLGAAATGAGDTVPLIVSYLVIFCDIDSK